MADARPRVLVVDEQHTWLSFAVEALRLAGYSVEASSEPAVISSQVSGGNSYSDGYDAVVLGFAVIGPSEVRTIKTACERTTAVVVLSTRLLPEDMRAGFLAGARDVAPKPYDRMTLSSVVAGVLPHPRSVSDPDSQAQLRSER